MEISFKTRLETFLQTAYKELRQFCLRFMQCARASRRKSGQALGANLADFFEL